MSRTHDVTISAFDLDRLERELAAMSEQLDRVRAEFEQWRMSSVCRELSEPRDITELLNKAGDALAAVKGGSDE